MSRGASAAVALSLVVLIGAAAAAHADDHVPQPYAPNEFPGWMSDVWRAEAIFVGVFPLSLFVTLEVYDSYRYFSKGLDPVYAPWPLGSGATAPYDPSETLWLAVSAMSLSLAVSGIDFILGRLHESTPRS